MGPVVILKNLISRPFNYAKQNGFLKMLIGCVGRNDWDWRGACYPSITLDY